MSQTSSVIVCLAYILGLLSTGVSWGGYGVALLGIGIGIVLLWIRRHYINLLSRSWLVEVKPQVWLIAGLVGFLATVYFQVRTPHPGANDISQFVNRSQVVTVEGRVASTPRLTRSQREQFWLDVTQVQENVATGKLYVTVPLSEAVGLHEQQLIAVSGVLYKPKPAANPGGFDFKAYLAQEGGFAGLKGSQVKLQQDSQWGWWTVRQKIIDSQGRWLGIPEGSLVSAMVLGNKVVNLPFDLSDAFIRVGLAHALAASGFQVSLILGVVITATRRFSSGVQFGIGVMALLIFVGLAGLQPSVLRAVVMGIGVLTGLVMQRQVKPLGLLLLAASLLLLINPIWIWNLGFEFSFLATMGLVVTVPAVIKRLDWLPPAIATIIAVPIAAYIWTLPLQLYKFGLVSPYSIVVNIITTLPLSIISIGAFISAIAAVIIPILGSVLAWLLYYPARGLINIINFFHALPGTTIAVKTISTLQLIIIYGLIILVWLQTWWRRRWWFGFLMAISLVVIPVWQAQASLVRVTVLTAKTEPVLVIQDRGKVILVNSGDENTARFTVLPFLQQQGVNQINWAIATNSNLSNESGWLQVLSQLPIKNFYYYPNLQANTIIKTAVEYHQGKYDLLNAGKIVNTGSTTIELIDDKKPILKLKINNQIWLVLENLKLNEQKKLSLSKRIAHTQVILWSGGALDIGLLKHLQPKVAIAFSASKVERNTLSMLRKAKTDLFLLKRDGAIQWTTGKFERTIDTIENKSLLL